ncbi:MAG TPA: glycosyltransferase family 2 protein [Flavitalea sp.]|nr:glycosyltransferase family 2 protein [Flavitalea sp.]
MMTVLQILSYLLFILLGIPVAYFLLMAIAGKFRRSVTVAEHEAIARIAVLIPAYKEDNVIIQTCRDICNHNYPTNNFSVFVAAHHLKAATIAELKKMTLQLFIIESDYGSKALSLQRLLNEIDITQFDLALILDADNIVQAGALKKINDAFVSGIQSVQLHRIAKNTESNLSYLEGISEEINNNLFRQGPRALNLSASTIGSGMAFPIKKLKEIYNLDGIIYNPACDRIIDFEIMKAGIDIEYLDNVFVWDEKVSSAKVFRKQRRRWIESQLIHISLFFKDAARLNFSSLNVINKFISNLFPPRVILLGLICIVNIVTLLPIGKILAPGKRWWMFLLIAYLFTLLISVPRRYLTFRAFKAILYLPVVFLNMLLAFFKLNPGRREFIHTPKAYNEKRGSI